MVSEAQHARMLRMFYVYDCNRDGVLTWDDFSGHYRKLAKLRGVGEESKAYQALRAMLTSYWENLVAAADVNADGRVTQEEWLRFATGMLHMLQQAADSGAEWPLTGWIDSLFGVIDADGDDRITLAEYRDWLDSLGIAGEMDVDGAFRSFDKASDDCLTRAEFTNISRQFWLNPDPHVSGSRWIGP